MVDSRSRKERKLGRTQKYVNAGFTDSYYPGVNRIPSKFIKPKGILPVRGGRWSVRKLASYAKDGKRWEAYNNGSLKFLTCRFHTHQEAVEYASKIARFVKGL
jgi:hypothetical protein